MSSYLVQMASYGDDSIIPRKLLFDGDGTGEDKKLQILIKNVFSWVANDDVVDTESDQETFMKLQASVFDVKLRRNQRDLGRKCTQTEIDKFQNTFKVFADRIEDIKNDIEKQQELLRRAQLVRQHFVECEFLVKAINQEPPRKKLEKEIKRLRGEIGEVKTEKRKLDEKWNAKIKQCQVLSTSANVLRSILQEDTDGLIVCVQHSDEEGAIGNI